MSKIHTLGNYKYYYHRKDWYIIYPDGSEERFGGYKDQVEFYINHLMSK